MIKPMTKKSKSSKSSKQFKISIKHMYNDSWHEYNNIFTSKKELNEFVNVNVPKYNDIQITEITSKITTIEKTKPYYLG